MAQLIYNYIQFNPNTTKTNVVDRVARYSDDGSEYKWTDFTIDISATYSPFTTAYPGPGSPPEDTDVFIRSALMQPRCPLYFSEFGIPIVELGTGAASGTVFDCENGPQPVSLSINRIASGTLFFIRYVIKFSIIECPVGSFLSAIASSRYSRSESIDAQMRSTIVTNGRAYFRSNVLDALGQNADSFRSYIIPRPFLYYIRKQVLVNLDPSGIILEFTAIDEQQFIDLGDESIPGTAGSCGIRNMGLTYSTAPVKHGDLGWAGLQSIVQIDTFAEGDLASDTWAMMQFLFSCIQNKLGDIATTGVMMDVRSSEDVFNKKVTLSLTAMTVVPAVGKANPQIPNLSVAVRGYVGTPIASLPSTQGVNPQPPWSNGTRTFTAYELAVNAFAIACQTTPLTVGIDTTGINTPGDLGNDSGLQGSSPEVLIYFNPNLAPGTSLRQTAKNSSQTRKYQNVTADPSYLNYVIMSEYDTPQGVTQGFVSTTASSSSQSGSQSNIPSSVMLQLFQPATRRIINFVIERIGAPPEIPSPTPNSQDGMGHTLLKSTITPFGPELFPDTNTPLFRVKGTYIYALLKKVDPSNTTIPFDIPPWANLVTGNNTSIITSDYEQNILQFGSVQSSGTG